MITKKVEYIDVGKMSEKEAKKVVAELSHRPIRKTSMWLGWTLWLGLIA